MSIPNDWHQLKVWARKMGPVYKVDLIEFLVRWANLRGVVLSKASPEQIHQALAAGADHLLKDRL